MKSDLEKIFLKFLHALTKSFLWHFLLTDFTSQKGGIFIKFSNKNGLVSAWRNLKNIFSRPLFIINFSPKILISCPYSILTGHTKVESVAYQVLKCLSPIYLVYLAANLDEKNLIRLDKTRLWQRISTKQMKVFVSKKIVICYAVTFL